MICHLYFPEYTFDSSVKCEKSKVVIAAYIDVLCSLRSIIKRLASCHLFGVNKMNDSG